MWLVLLFFNITIVLAQEKNVSGNITDTNNVPLIGVNILVKGTTTGALTDFDGNYTIKSNVGDVLVFSYVGLLTQEIEVTASNTIDVVLLEDAQSLEEVVVTAFGIKRNPKNLGYAVNKVETDNIVENSEPDLIRSLNGKVPGVNVNVSTGVAGASNQINIRGATTLSGSSQPLIIVDGIAYDNSQISTSSQTTGGGGYESGLSTLDPNNIASVSVLKSTAAAALYGSRATDGVIVITTKTGSASANTNNKMSVSVNSGVYFENIANLPEYQNTYGNGVNFGYANANGSWGPRYDSLATIATWPNLLNAFPELFGPTVPYVAQPNNVKNLFKTGTVFDNSINLSAGGEKGSFSATISDLDQEGYIPFNTYNRTSFSAGGNYELNNKMTVGASLSYTESEQIGGFFGQNQFNGSASSFARALWLGRTWDLSLPYEHPITGASVTPNNGWDHPLWSWEHDKITTNTDRIVTNISLGFPINKNINASFRVGYNKYTLDREQIRDIGSRAANGLGSLTTDRAVNEDLESTLLLNFDYELSEDFGINGILGMNTLQNTFTRNANLGTVFALPNIFTLANAINVSNLADSYSRARTIGAFAELGLSYKNYLFLTATGRNDWSSTLPKSNQSYFYPSISTSIIFTDALELESDVLTFGKLRAGFASAGRDASAEFLNRTFVQGNPYSGIPVVGNPITLSDQDITPEFTDEIEVGTDLEFFKRRIAVDFTWYKKTTTDLISAVSVPATSGYTTFNTNIGGIENKGIEIGLTLVPIQTDNFKWSLYTTFTKNDNVVTELVEGLERIQFDANQVPHAIVGKPFGVFYGSRFARDADGNYLINQSGGGIVQDLQNGIIGDPNPDFKMSFINNISYKGFNLQAQVDWKEGGDIHSTSIPTMLGRGVTRDTENREHSFVLPGFYGDNSGNPILDANGNQIPNTTQITMNDLYFSPAGGNTFGINSVAEASVYDGTVYRLRELSLSYDFPKKWLEKTPFGSLSISAVGNNLWYFAPNVPKYTNFDPDVTAFGSTRVQGVEIASAPSSTRYGMKVNITF